MAWHSPHWKHLRERRDEVLRELERRLVPLGWKYTERFRRFDQSVGRDVRRGFVFEIDDDPRPPSLGGPAVTPTPPALRVTPRAFVRHHRVERLASLPGPSFPETETLKLPLEGALLAHDGDVPLFVSGLVDTCLAHGVPWIEQHTDLREVQRALQTPAHATKDPVGVDCHRFPVVAALLDGRDAAEPFFEEGERLFATFTRNPSSLDHYREFRAAVRKELA